MKYYPKDSANKNMHSPQDFAPLNPKDFTAFSILRIFLICVFLLTVSMSYSQQNSSDKNDKGIILSLGAGTSISDKSFVLSPNIVWELHKHINVATGVDVYFRNEKYNSEINYSVNIIPYYAFKPWKKSIIRIGIGGAYYKRGFAPIFSTKFDYEIFNDNYLGVESKSLVVFGVDPIPLFVFLMNYSIRLP